MNTSRRDRARAVLSLIGDTPMVPLHFAPEQRTIGLNEKIASSLRSRRHRVAQDIAQSVFIDLA